MSEPVRLSQTVSCAGCAAKLDPNMLVGVLDQVPWPTDPRVEVGFHTCDDAAVYRDHDGVQMVATTDFFTPIVDDPSGIRCGGSSERSVGYLRHGGNAKLCPEHSALPRASWWRIAGRNHDRCGRDLWPGWLPDRWRP